MVSRRVVKLIGIFLIVYSTVQISLFIITYAQNMDPDWIVMFKMMYNFMILPSAILLIIAVSKDNMTIVTVSEIIFVSAFLGFLLYTLLLLIMFLKENKYGLPFVVFIIQRIIFFCALLGSICIVEKYRRRRVELIRHDRWSDVTSMKSSKVTSDSQYERTIEHSSTTTDLDVPTKTAGEGDLFMKGLPRPMGGVCGLPLGFPPPPNINPKTHKRRKKIFKFYDDPPPDPPTIYIGPPLPPGNPQMGNMGGQMMGQYPMIPMAPHPILPMPPGTQIPTPYTQRAQLPIGCMGMPPPMGPPLTQPFMPFSNPFGTPVPLPPGVNPGVLLIPAIILVHKYRKKRVKIQETAQFKNKKHSDDEEEEEEEIEEEETKQGWTKQEGNIGQRYVYNPPSPIPLPQTFNLCNQWPQFVPPNFYPPGRGAQGTEMKNKEGFPRLPVPPMMPQGFNPANPLMQGGPYIAGPPFPNQYGTPTKPACWLKSDPFNR